MNILDKFSNELTKDEQNSINGGDGLTEALFRFLGWTSVIIEAGFNVPHANNPEGLGGSRPFE
jgi:hypothetical protein